MSAASQAPGGAIVLVRHAETEWSRDGRHTGRVDIPLTASGRDVAAGLRERLSGHRFALVLCSPLQRARETCALAGLDADAQYRDDLQEWDYGDYDGLTTAQIRAQRPDWNLWRDGCPGGESAADVGVRADRVIAELEASAGEIAVFAHGHLLRVLGARWGDLEPQAGRALALDPAGLSTLGREHDWRVLRSWNATAD